MSSDVKVALIVTAGIVIVLVSLMWCLAWNSAKTSPLRQETMQEALRAGYVMTERGTPIAPVRTEAD